MRVVLQRVSEASVTIEGKMYGSIGNGMLILLGIEHDDDQSDADWLIQKTIGMRIFSDQEGKMNYGINDVNGSFLVISQFTLHASTKKGNRPSYIRAARPEQAVPLYEYFLRELESSHGAKIETGKFGADMKVSLVNDGPVTIIIDSKNRE
jgi:D-tyrosyl-tRNA(Tyr) deacylase